MWRPPASDASSGVRPFSRGLMYAAYRSHQLCAACLFSYESLVLGRLMQEIRESPNVHGQSSHSRPGSLVLTSCISHPLPSGSLKDAHVKYERPCGSGPGTRASIPVLWNCRVS